MDNVDNTNPSGKWEFDAEVSKVFTNMLTRSIPDYEVMRDLCFRVGRNYVHRGSIVDLGCSNGLASKEFVDNFRKNKVLLCDVSDPMLQECRSLYEKEIKEGQVEVLNFDIRGGVPFSGVDLIISCLTLQFTPIEYRQDILSSAYESLSKHGALILVEKVLGNSSEIDSTLVSEYYKIKRENGYTEERIQTKRKSLEGVLVPLTASFNEQLLKESGFRKVDCFWRCLNFAAWIAIK